MYHLKVTLDHATGNHSKDRDKLLCEVIYATNQEEDIEAGEDWADCRGKVECCSNANASNFINGTTKRGMDNYRDVTDLRNDPMFKEAIRKCGTLGIPGIGAVGAK